MQRNLNDVSCSLWIPQQMDLLLHIVKVYVCLLWIPQQIDLLHMDIVVLFYVPDLLWRQQSKLLINYALYVYVMPEEQIPGVTLH